MRLMEKKPWVATIIFPAWARPDPRPETPCGFGVFMADFFIIGPTLISALGINPFRMSRPTR
jgi:hypothetical protein